VRDIYDATQHAQRMCQNLEQIKYISEASCVFVAITKALIAASLAMTKDSCVDVLFAESNVEYVHHNVDVATTEMEPCKF
jgi:hypothetical protein